MTKLQLGNITYTQEQLLSILHEPVPGNDILILATQKIAAKLKIANGADRIRIQQTLVEADALVGGSCYSANRRRILAAARRVANGGDSWRLQRGQLVRSEV
jgi:hypothetical protein